MKRKIYLKCSSSGCSSILRLRSGGAAKPIIPTIGQTSKKRVKLKGLELDFNNSAAPEARTTEITVQIIRYVLKLFVSK